MIAWFSSGGSGSIVADDLIAYLWRAGFWITKLPDGESF